jgi:hypothetical protein
MSAVEPSTRRLGVIELSESVVRLIKDWAIPNEGSRGLIIELTKVSRSKHSRHEVQLIREHPPAWCMALEPLDLHEVLSRTWDRIEMEKGAALIGAER